ncbi:MAG TPA: TRAP transporter large permease subunit, partial [Bacillota bacterium]|nr:TRAP transporter large permease subunit [Bacillota bacterium]
MALWIFVVFLTALVFAVPIAVSMVLGAMTPLILGGPGSSIQQLIANSFSGSDTTPILAVPLFILGGVLMAEGGISRRLFNFFAYFVGNLTGGLPCAVILTCLFYGAISGSGPATTAAVGSMTIPFLVDMGYDKTWSAGMVATAGGLGVIIPPSIPFVLYSLATGVSTGALFLGGVLPGILIGLCMMVYAVIYCKRKGEDKEKIRAKMTELRSQGFLNLLKDSFWALLSPVIVLGGIYS